MFVVILKPLTRLCLMSLVYLRTSVLSVHKDSLECIGNPSMFYRMYLSSGDISLY